MLDLNEVYRLSANEIAAGDYILNEIDSMCRGGRFNEINDILIKVDFSRLSIELLILIVMCANRVKSQLPEWPIFLTCVREHILTQKPGCDIVGIMHGFTP